MSLRLLVLLAATPALGACATSSAPAAGGASGATASVGADGAIQLSDPTGDDNGPGTYTYPTDPVYTPGSFDLTGVVVKPGASETEIDVTVNARIEDAWDSKAWGGNGFSTQMAFVFLDTDHQPGSGVTEGLPGLNIRFKPEEAWDRVVIISPQGPTRVNSEIDQKAPQWKDRIIVPRITRASGRTLTAVVETAALGGRPSAKWGYQVAMQSNEGFPAKTDLLTRKVNEFEGQHRFGGGSDYDNDPQVMDILVPRGGDQKAILGAYNKQTQEPKPEDLAVVPMVYPEP
jgi:carbohydrate-binding DOMON domain-containing protein